MFFDLCIIGGGAAGLMAAITAKEANAKLNVCIMERLDRVGKKIALTGNGRCNITNKNISANNYYGKDSQFVVPVLSRFSTADTCAFFERLGVPVIFEGNKGYPRSLQAASVVDALRFRADELGVSTLVNTRISAIKKQGDRYIVSTAEDNFKCRAVIVCAGLLSGGSKLGCDGEMLSVLKGLGLDCTAVSPAIVQVKTDTDFVRQLKGIKIDAEVSLIRNGTVLRREFGETLFCDYGLSGPPILQLSGHAKKGDKIVLDLAPEFDFSALIAMLSARAKTLKNRKNDEFLSGLLNKRLGQVVLKRTGVALSGNVSDITPSQIKAVCGVIKGFECCYTDNNGFNNSQVTMGGILTREFDGRTLMSKKYPGLFAAGELLDITGDCGGYNLQWAWSSGYTAALGAVEFLK